MLQEVGACFSGEAVHTSNPYGRAGKAGTTSMSASRDDALATGLPACCRRYGLVSSESRFTPVLCPVDRRLGRTPPAQELERNGDPECDAEREQHRIDGLVAEHPAPDVPEQHGVRRPQHGRKGDVGRKAARPQKLDKTGRERRCSSPAGNEARDDEDVAPAALEEALRPAEPPLRLLAA